MHYNPRTALIDMYAIGIAAALAGCGKDAPVQTGKAVSGLEMTVLAETRNDGSKGSVFQKEERYGIILHHPLSSRIIKEHIQKIMG